MLRRTVPDPRHSHAQTALQAHPGLARIGFAAPWETAHGHRRFPAMDLSPKMLQRARVDIPEPEHAAVQGGFKKSGFKRIIALVHRCLRGLASHEMTGRRSDRTMETGSSIAKKQFGTFPSATPNGAQSSGTTRPLRKHLRCCIVTNEICHPDNHCLDRIRSPHTCQRPPPVTGRPLSRQGIDATNRHLLRRYDEFRPAAGAVTDALKAQPEMTAVALMGSMAREPYSEVPLFAPYQRVRIKLWHECKCCSATGSCAAFGSEPASSG